MPSVPAPTHSIDGQTTLAVLAGGEGSRMGMPKALLTLHGQPILEYLLDQFAWPGETLLVTAPGRERPPGAERFSREVSDPVAGMGPLRGVLTAMEHMKTPLLLVLTVDMPAIRKAHCQLLLDALQSSEGALGVMFSRRSIDSETSTIVGNSPQMVRSADPTLNERDQCRGETQLEPFPLALRSSARSILRRQLEKGRRSVHGLLEEPRFVALEAPATWNPEVWKNLNFPADLRSEDR